MRPFALLLLISFAASGVFAQGWQWQNPRVCGNDLGTIGSVGNSVWAASWYGDVLWSTDAGQNWTLRNVAGAPPFKIIFMDDLHGWGLMPAFWRSDTSHGGIFATTDGGFTWAPQILFPLNNTAFWDIFFTDLQHGWVCGQRADSLGDRTVVLRTTNGGLTWTEHALNLYSYDSNIFFLEATEGWLSIFAINHLLHTTDGGETWDTVSTTTAPLNVQFVDSQDGWGRCGGLPCHTTDGGVSWTSYNTGASHGIRNLQYVARNIVWAVTESGQACITVDGGAHWTVSQACDSSLWLNALHFSDSHHGWVAGLCGAISYTSDGGAHWSVQNGSTFPHVGFPGLASVSFTSLLNGWVAGNGVIVHTSDGGQSWSVRDSLHGAYALVTVDSLSVWALGADDDRIRHTTNGGASWDTVYAGPGGYIDHLTGFGRDNLWTVKYSIYGDGDSCVCRSTDAGLTWTCVPVTNPSGYDSYSKLRFIDEIHGWRYGGASTESLYGFIQHTTDGGETWVDQLGPLSSSIDALSFVDSLHGWAGGYMGVYYKTSDGGAHWNELPYPGGGSTCIQFLDTLHGWADPSLRTTDGGNTWEDVHAATQMGIAGMCFTDFDHGWMVGQGGIILYYDGTASASKPRATLVPMRADLSAYPNPFNPTTVLSFDVPRSSRVTLSIYDLTGRLVKTLADRVYAQGSYRLSFDGSNLPSGIYFARLQGKSFSKTQKLVLLK